jgi:hypothetical protein
MTPVADEKVKPCPRHSLPVKGCDECYRVYRETFEGPWRPASAVAEAAGEKGWQPIETAPASVDILVFHKAFGILTAFKSPRGKWWNLNISKDEELMRPTHWQPLPVAPASAAPASPAENPNHDRNKRRRGRKVAFPADCGPASPAEDTQS